jgi:hypothetical protein
MQVVETLNILLETKKSGNLEEEYFVVCGYI